MDVSLPGWLAKVKETIPQWTVRLKDDSGSGRYRFAVDAYVPYDLNSSVMMRITRQTTGDNPGDEELQAWLEYILSHQRPEDGLFIDESLEGRMGAVLGSPTEEELLNLRRMITRNSLESVLQMGGKPRYPIMYEETFETPAEIVEYMERLQWDGPWAAGSWAGAVILFQHFNRLLGDEKADEIIRAGVDWLLANQRPENGAWHDGSHPALHNQINGIFKIWIQLRGITDFPVQYPEKIVDLCIQGMREDPELNGAPDACSIFDVALVLDTALRFTDHRSDEVAEICASHLSPLEQMVRPDGAFSYNPDGPLQSHGGLNLAQPTDQSDVAGSALLTQAIAMLCNLCGLRDELGWRPTTETAMALPAESTYRA